ncbi:MAG TPA: T9SS type A sorting domain-containing protein, partial [Gammaproteobacteria bacterium]|nr:T9SS type A sorting domain-containing protein [Gammaproteobacteria bacterium]
VAIFNLENKLYKWFELGKTTYAKLDLASINEKGFYLLVIKTDKGITIKKIVKG